MRHRIASWFLLCLLCLQAPTVLQGAVPSEERAALIAIYNATNGDKWDDKTGWKDGTLETDGFGPYGSEGNWYGITVSTIDSQDHVIQMSLQVNNLIGTIPPEIGNLKKLENINLYLNKITGIPPELGNLSELTYLDIGYNQLTTIPGELGKLGKLEELWLPENKLTELPGELGNLGNLKILIVTQNRLTSLPPELGNLRNLKDLFAFINRLTSLPPELGNLTNLESLSLFENELTEIPTELGNLGKLKSIYLENNRLTSIPPELGNLQNLQTLFLGSNDLTAIPGELGNLPNLNTLLLTGNRLTTLPPELGNLQKLTGLFAGWNKLSTLPAELGNLSTLGILNLSNNNLSSIPTELGNCSGLGELHLDNNELSSVPGCLAKLTRLRELYLDHNRMQGNIPENLGNLVNLEWFDLSANQLTGSIPTTLTHIPTLEIQYGCSPLNIDYNGLYTADNDLLKFLDEKANGWDNTQTIAPSGLFATSGTTSSVTVSWTRIRYTGDSGGYIVYYSTSPGGSWTQAGMTKNKSASSFTVTGLNEGTTYYFMVKTQTNPHAGNANTIISEASERAVCTAGSIGPFGSFDTPSEGATVSSSIAVTGWALDDVGIAGVKIYRESEAGEPPVFIGDAAFVEGARPDIEQAYPAYPDNDKAGWGYMMLTNFLPNGGNGTFTLHAVATDLEGNRVPLGTKTILCDNENAVKPFGAMDTPGMGETVEAGIYRNHGWVLTPLPNMVPPDGTTIDVYVDGVFLGHPVYNLYREDIASLFPGYANSGGAGGYFDLDLTGYADGLHTIYWVAKDETGNADGIGSRYFKIQTPQGVEQGMTQRGRSGRDILLSPEDLASVQVDDTGFVTIKKGVDRNGYPETVYPDDSGTVTIEMKELERLEVHLNGSDDSSAVYTGYSSVGGLLKRLPVGSTLDAQRGIFYWQAGPAFHGNYRFVFIEKRSNGELSMKYIKVRITS